MKKAHGHGRDPSGQPPGGEEAVWEIVCELIGESERGGHGGRGGYRGGAEGAAGGIVTGGLGCEDDGGGVDMEEVAEGDRGGAGVGLGRAHG